MDIDYTKIGKRIKSVRESKNMTQEELAEKAGLSNNYISNIECARSKPSIETLVKICNASETTPDYVLLDSVHASKELLIEEIAIKLKKCTSADMQYISQMITLHLDTKEKKENE